MKKWIYLSVFVVLSQFCVSTAWASSAGFKISGANLEQPKPNGPHTVDLAVGQSLEIVAKGWAYPRSRDPEVAKGGPTKADAGTWMFDPELFKLLKTESDGTEYKLVLKASKPGQHTIRFVGVVLGYGEVREILVNVSKPAEE